MITNEIVIKEINSNKKDNYNEKDKENIQNKDKEKNNILIISNQNKNLLIKEIPAASTRNLILLNNQQYQNQNNNNNNNNNEDINIGAYLVSHLRHYCENCGTHETPQWRKGWYSSVLNREVLLCNACGLKYYKKQFCPYCKYVYGNREQNNTSTSWLTCSVCERMVHAQCEIKYNPNSPIAQILETGINTRKEFKKLPYICPSCRNIPVSLPTK